MTYSAGLVEESNLTWVRRLEKSVRQSDLNFFVRQWRTNSLLHLRHQCG